MINASKVLWIIGSSLMSLLGLLHLYLTFFTNRFSVSDEKLMQGMKSASPLLTKELNFWNAWVGFNGSHGFGILFLGVLNIFLAVEFFALLQHSHFYFLFNIATVGFYVFLAAKYWFSKPLIGTSLTLLCYASAYILILVN